MSRPYNPKLPLLDRIQSLEEELLGHVHQVISPETIKQNMRDRAAIITEARLIVHTWQLIDQLREPYGSVTILCDNEEPPPNVAIEVDDEWTDWEPRRFEGDTILDCLKAALDARAKSTAP